jgi:phospholipid/cholesterol/gamma-HCH transport system ATP-binding protein
MEIIKIENLSTIFGENIVHNNISFSINEKEIFGVLGGSGSGKSVLVKQIVMLNEIQKGTIKIFDKDISNLNLEQSQDLKQQFSYLFQFGALFSFLTVIENIAVMLKEYTNLPNDLIEKIAYTNLEIVGLPKNCANLYPSEISGGMKKRVALARSLAIATKDFIFR